MKRHLWKVSLCAVAVLVACTSKRSNPDGGSPLVDAGITDAGVIDAGSTDAGSMDAGSMDGGTAGLTCAKLLGCDQGCNSSSPPNCTDMCFAKTTAHGQQLFDALDNCINTNCPDTDGGACASPSSQTCSSCQEKAATTKCISNLAACESDNMMGPPNPDGGHTDVDGGQPMDAGMAVNCGVVQTCAQACAQGDSACQQSCLSQGTSAAQALAQALFSCVSRACPDSDGGICSDAGTACGGCEQQAFYGACADQSGACEADMSATGDGGTMPVAEQGGTIQTLVPMLSQPQVVRVQNGLAYFAEITQSGPVMSVPVAGGTVTTLSPGQPYPMGLTTDSNYVYTWNSGSFSGGSALNNSDGSVVQIPIAGGTATTLTTGIVAAYNAPYLNAVAVDSKGLYWVSGGPGTDGAINTTPVGSDTPTVLYDHQAYPEAVVSDGTNLYWGNWGTFDAQGNYNNDGAVLRAPVGGGMPVTLASGLSAPAAIAVDSQNVYWTNIGRLSASGFPSAKSGAVMEVPIAGGSVVTIAANQDIPLGIAVDGSNIYWTQFTLSSPGAVMTAPVGGGTVVTLVGNAVDPFGVTASGGTVFWTRCVPTGIGDGALLSLTLP